jgi:tRNA/rRNA methyltransferase
MNNISIILIKPQMGENIGATARAMKNFGISDLRIVSPRDGWPNQKANDMAANAEDIILSAKIFDTTEDALKGLNLVFATASKTRDLNKQVVDATGMVEVIHKNSASKIGIIFGKESSGLDNEDISHANYHVCITASKEYDSLNLAQAVNILCYEIFKSNLSPALISKNNDLAERKDINEMIKFLDEELTAKNFFQVPEKKHGMMINIRNIFTNNIYTEQEVRTLRGIFNALRK